ncbi:MAG: protein kinase [Nannocystis sp.]|nr:protein kinase [Nannocystis sp.]
MLGAQIDHPHVVPIFDHGEERALGGEPVLFLVLPLLQGVTLRQRLLEPAMPIADALRLTIQLLDGLAELHKLGAVHRDLKPENCLIVQRQGRDHLILLDLGLAKNSHRPAALARALLGPRRDDRHPRLRLPEQAREQRITPAADIYAVGVILFELLTRRVPFPGTTALEVLSAHASEMAPSVTARAPDRGISDDLEALVASSLEKIRLGVPRTPMRSAGHSRPRPVRWPPLRMATSTRRRASPPGATAPTIRPSCARASLRRKTPCGLRWWS